MPRSQPWTTEQFIEKANTVEKHRGKYGYSHVVYVNSQTKVLITCLTCKKDFLQVPNSHLQGYGCDVCAHAKNHKGQTHSKEQMVERANAVHGVGRYDYIDSEYTLSRVHINIKCNVCKNIFPQTPNNHISKGFGCPHCAGNAILTTEKFIEKAMVVHPDLYNYSLTNYVRSNKNVIILCKKTNKLFDQTPNNHLSGNRCPCCFPKCSKPSNQYMSYIAVSNPTIQYGEKEYRIKGSRYRADGYIPVINHVLEFHGCIFHGCPKCLSPDAINPITKKYNGELLKITRTKQAFIEAHGYKYTEVWDCDWKRAIRCVKLIQKKWRAVTSDMSS